MKGIILRRRLPPLVVILAAAALAAGVCLYLTRPPDNGASPFRFTSVSYAKDQAEAPAAKTDLGKCSITLAYAEFLVDGSYHTPKVTITDQGKKLTKNVDYKLTFSGGRDAGTSSVKITGIGNYRGTVTKTYKGIPAASAAAPKTTTPSAPAKAQTASQAAKQTASAKANKPVYVTTTAAPKMAKTAKQAAPAKEKKTTTASEPENTKLKVVYKTTSASKEKAPQTIKSISAYTFPETGASMKISAKASSGLGLEYRSSNSGVVSVDAKGGMRAKRAGTAKITITQKGSQSYKSASREVKVTVPAVRSREAALAPWRHVLIDTFFHINDRKYSRKDPGKYWKDKRGRWSGRTGKKGNTQSCVTLTTVSLKRIGLLSHGSGCIWLSSNHGTEPNQTVRKLRKSSRSLAISYPHKSLKYLAKNDLIRYGDILCRSGHTFVYMGTDSGGHPLIYESGSRRDIGNGTCVRWGHHSGGHADKLTGKINQQIQKSNAAGNKWRKGKIGDAAFRGHRASGSNLNKPVHIVCSIRTFKVRTSCINGAITPGNIYMAGESPTIKFSSASGKPVEYVKVDGRKVRAKSEYTFKKITADHSVAVKYRQ